MKVINNHDGGGMAAAAECGIGVALYLFLPWYQQ